MTDTPLQQWMTKKGVKDHHLAELAKASRVQISRIRRGKSGAAKPLALRLSAITKISWEKFIEPTIQVPPNMKAG